MFLQMMKLPWSVILFTSFGLKLIYCQSASNFLLRDFHWCEEYSQQKVQLFINPKNSNPGIQLLDVNLSTPISLGNNVLAKFKVEADTQLGVKDLWAPLFTIEDSICKIFDMFFGQLVYNLEISFGIIPKSCPIPRGSYHATNHTADYNCLKLQTFPFGTIRATGTGLEKNKKEKLWCFVMIISNQRKDA